MQKKDRQTDLITIPSIWGERVSAIEKLVLDQ